MTEEMSEAYGDKGDRGALSTLGNIEFRSLLKVLVIVSVITGTSVTLVGLGSQPALAAGISASDVSITTANGTITAITLQPTISANWTSVEDPVHKVTIALRVGNSTNVNQLEWPVSNPLNCNFDSHPDCGEHSGSYSVSRSQDLNILNDSRYQTGEAPFNASEFSASDGATETKDVKLEVWVKVEDSGLTTIRSRTSSTTFTVTVTNEEGNTTVSASMNTGISG